MNVRELIENAYRCGQNDGYDFRDADVAELERKAFEAGAFALAKGIQNLYPYVGPSPTWLDDAYGAFKKEP